MDKDKEYYYSGANGYVTMWGEVKDDPEHVIVLDGGDYGELVVVRKKDLVPKEESYMWKESQKKADELRTITAKAQENFDAIVEKVIAKAVSSLQSRIKMNVLFGSSGGNTDAVMLTIANELEKLVKEKAKDVIKDDKDPF